MMLVAKKPENKEREREYGSNFTAKKVQKYPEDINNLVNNLVDFSV